LRQVHRAKLPDDVSEIKLDLKIDFDEIGDYQPRWNAAPTSNLPVVTCILTLMRWGLIPSWAKDLKIGYSTFNARAETPTKRAAFRGAWRAGLRCLVIADGYYEWRDADKQPFAIALANRAARRRSLDYGTVALARGRGDQILCLHDRMPVVISLDCWADWLGENATSKACCSPIRTRPWRSGRLIGGSPMSGKTARIYSRRSVFRQRHSATHKPRNRVGQARPKT